MITFFTEYLYVFYNIQRENILKFICIFQIDEVCKRSIYSGKTHVCKVLNDCKTAIDDIRDNVKYPTICSFKGSMPVVCCAPESVPRNKRLEKEENEAPTDSPEITREYDL